MTTTAILGGMREPDAAKVLGCRSTWRSDANGTIWSLRDEMNGAIWGKECTTIARYLKIAPENHAGHYQSEYMVRHVKDPLGGLLGEHMYIWVLINYNTGTGGALATIVAQFYPKHPTRNRQELTPQVLYLDTYDAGPDAWHKVAQEHGKAQEYEGVAMKYWEQYAVEHLSDWWNHLWRRPFFRL